MKCWMFFNCVVTCDEWSLWSGSCGCRASPCTPLCSCRGRTWCDLAWTSGWPAHWENTPVNTSYTSSVQTCLTYLQILHEVFTASFMLLLNFIPLLLSSGSACWRCSTTFFFGFELFESCLSFFEEGSVFVSSISFFLLLLLKKAIFCCFIIEMICLTVDLIM